MPTVRDVAAQPLYIASSDVSGTRLTGRGIVRGFSLRNTAGIATTVRLHDGTSATGLFLVALSLAIAASETKWFAGEGVWFERGLFYELPAGATEGAIYVIPETRLVEAGVVLSVEDPHVFGPDE